MIPTAPDSELARIIEKLLADTDAGRTTLRLQARDGTYPVVAEACAPGVTSIADETGIDVRNAPTVAYLREKQSVLVQDDLSDADPPPPRELIELYGARAQMLAPLFAVDGELVGIMSVHHVEGPRRWTNANRLALETAVDSVNARRQTRHK